MKLLKTQWDIAELLSAFVRRGGWLAAPLGGAVLLYLMQERLVFNPVRTPPVLIRPSANHRLRGVAIRMRDGTRLHGWYMRPVRYVERAPAILYFGGRSEEVSWVSGPLSEMSGAHCLFMNYRGYGQSHGTPSEAALCSDALELYDWLSEQRDVDARRISIVGRSLGTGIAVYAAAMRQPAATVLVTPYDSIVEIARRRFPYCAAGVLLKHRFESMRLAVQAKCPVLVLLAQMDEIVPTERALRLVNAWPADKEVVTIAGTGHCDIQSHPETWQAIHRFLDRVQFLRTDLPAVERA
jgi:cephalosporin-C deacetylase-like acetyl esterase